MGFHMKRTRNACVAALVSGGVALALGCNGRIAECNKLIERANATMTSADEAQKKMQGKEDKQALVQMSMQLDKAKTDIQGVSLTDTTLVHFRDQYAASLDHMSAAAKSMEDAVDKDDAQGASSAIKDMQTAADDNAKVVDGLNKYCAGSS
jgi:hypothetical protein